MPNGTLPAKPGHLAKWYRGRIECTLFIGSEPHINHSYEKIAVLMYVPIHHPHVYHARACMQIDLVKIVSINHVLTLNVAHHQLELKELFEAQADLEETKN